MITPGLLAVFCGSLTCVLALGGVQLPPRSWNCLNGPKGPKFKKQKKKKQKKTHMSQEVQFLTLIS